MDESIRKILTDIFGAQLIKYKQTKASLPIYLKNDKSFYEAVIGETRFVIVMHENPERLNVSALKKHLPKYHEAFGSNITYGFDKVTTFQRRSLVENGISFISGNGQVFLPFLGAFFSKCQMNDYNREASYLSPTAQALLLLLIYTDEEISRSYAAKSLKVSPMTISRASAELGRLEVLSERKRGTELLISRNGGKTEVYSKIRGLLINPVQEVVYVENDSLENGIIAGEYSLSKRSDLGYPRYHEYAISKKDYQSMNLKEYDPYTDIGIDLIRIQLWKYDPELFARNGQIDPISLICSFKGEGEEDERIHKCLTQIEGEMDKWQLTKI